MRYFIILASSLGLLLTACGGGGGSGDGGSSTANRAPILVSPNADQRASLNVEFSYDATQGGETFSDPDGDNLIYAVKFTPDDGIYSASNGVITGTPTTSGDVSATITASDGSDGITDTFIISTNSVPRLDAPNEDQLIGFGVAFTYDATQGGQTFTNPNGGNLTYQVEFDPDTGVYAANDGVITGTPSIRDDVNVTITASNDTGDVTDEFILSVNQTPVLAQPNADQTANITYPFTYDATQSGQAFTDANPGSTLSYVATFNPDNGVYTAMDGVISGTSTNAGDVDVTITASDGFESVTDSFTITSEFRQVAVANRFGGSIDLNNPDDYVNFTVPNYIPPPNTVLNPITDAGATLGRVLFYDRALSIDDTVACASCHQQEHAFSDNRVVSRGVAGGQTGRHSMRLINTVFSDETAFFWDERAVNLEAQVTAPIRDHNEHGFSGQDGRPDFDDLITKLDGIDYYDELFRFTFGDNDITEERIQSALSQFVNSIVSFDSRFDEGRAQVTDPFARFPNFTIDENEGKNIFMSSPADMGAGCRRCHADPKFSVFEDSGHIGVIGVANDPTAVDMTNTRSPSLRDLFKPNGETNGPFMHDGSMTTMREVMDHYDAIPVPTTEPLRTEFMDSIDQQLVEFGTVERLNLTDQEKDQVEAFLRTLTGNAVYTDPKWSNPFR